ncbi:MAG: hypothetical protein GY822_18800 [Deltaproteobacteria bacterium]|nr:hypothetical protein [Deltaproteobacteria bacterium]
MSIFFSPTLLISANAVYADADNLPADVSDHAAIGTQLHCRFSPPANVWTGFMALYALLSFAAIGGAMYGISQWMVQSTPWALLIFPIALVLIGFVYGATFIGQGKDSAANKCISCGILLTKH